MANLGMDWWGSYPLKLQVYISRAQRINHEWGLGMLISGVRNCGRKECVRSANAGNEALFHCQIVQLRAVFDQFFFGYEANVNP